MTTLTTKETSALRALIANALGAMGGKNAAQLHNDNCSWFDAGDLTARLSISRFEAAGIMSALAAKGIIFEHDPGDWYVTDDGIDIADTLNLFPN